MPKLTRATFTDQLRWLWDRAVANFEASDYLAPSLVGYDPMGRQVLLLGMTPEQWDDPQERAETHHAGVVGIPMPWTEHLEAIREVFTRHKTVAAAIIGEAWAVRGEASADILASGSRVADHPDRDEVIFVAGSWPREHLFSATTAEIVRDPATGTATLRPWGSPQPATGGPAAAVGSWLTDVLPGPY